MGIFWNMKVLTILSRVLTSLRYQNGYCGCRESQRYDYGSCAMIKLPLVAPKFRLRRVQKKGKKEQKMKNCVLQKKTFHTSYFWESIRIEKIVLGRCAHQNFFFTFRHQFKVRNYGNFVIHVQL